MKQIRTKQARRGFTLIETIIYIGLLAIILPMLSLSLLRLNEQFNLIDPRTRMEQKASLVLSELTNELTNAESIDITNSTFGTDTSVLVFKDDNSQTIILDTEEFTEDFSEVEQTVRRLRIQRGVDPAVLLSDKDMTVDKWNIQAVRNSSGTLTGLRINLEFDMLDETGVYQSASFDATTTIALQSRTTEL